MREVEVESEPHGRVTLRGLEIRPVSKLAAQQRPKISSASPLDVGALSDDSQRDERNDQLEKLGPENVVIYFQVSLKRLPSPPPLPSLIRYFSLCVCLCVDWFL